MSYEKDKEEIRPQKPKEMTDKLNPSDVLLFLNESREKAVICKASTDMSTKSSVVLSAKGKSIGASEVDNLEELHFFYVKMLRNNKSLAYKFENEDYEENINKGSFEF